jgi:hypothetical protein
VRLCCWAPHRCRPLARCARSRRRFQALDLARTGFASRKCGGRSVFDSALTKRLGPGHTSMVLSPLEAVQLFHLPLAGVPMDSARVRVMPRRPSLVAGEGSVLCRLDDDRGAAVKISQTDRRHHMHAVGPTGAGKTTLVNLALQDIEAGIGSVSSIPRATSSATCSSVRPSTRIASSSSILRRAAPGQAQRPRVRRPESARARHRRRGHDLSQELRTFLGPRTDDVLRAALIPSFAIPGATLTEVPLLLPTRAGLADQEPQH